jgi:hypothetical protein
MGFTRTGATYGTPNLTLTTANAAGSTASGIRTDASVLTYDTNLPAALTSGGSSATGSASVASRRDHVHGLPTLSDVTGPGSSVDDAIVRWNGTSGTSVQGYTSNSPTIGDTGIMSLPGQSAFSARVTSDILNVTGDGTLYTVIFGTEHYDQNGDFNTTTGTFTAPVAGRYLFTSCVSILGGSSSSGNEFLMQLYADSVGYTLYNYAACPVGASVPWQMIGLATVPMSASSTAIIRIRISGEGANNCDIEGGGASASLFTGTLVA